MWYEYPGSTTWLEILPLEDFESQCDGSFYFYLFRMEQYDIFVLMTYRVGLEYDDALSPI